MYYCIWNNSDCKDCGCIEMLFKRCVSVLEHGASNMLIHLSFVMLIGSCKVKRAVFIIALMVWILGFIFTFCSLK